MGACLSTETTPEEIEAREAEERRRDEQRRRDAMPPIQVMVLRADAEQAEIEVKQWQGVHESVLEGLQLDRYEWVLDEVRCGEEVLKAGATWESEGASSASHRSLSRCCRPFLRPPLSQCPTQISFERHPV